MNGLGVFDSYSIAARLLPALIALVPVIVTTAVWTPALYDLAYGILVPSIEGALAFLLMHIARSLGQRAERRLFDKWGGKPTSRWLLRSDGKLDELTKTRYRRYLEEHIDGWEAPSQADEETDGQGAMATYDSAVRRLREATRDRRDRPHFSLVFTENVSYGFLHNLYGLKWLGALIASLCVLFCAGGLFLTVSVDGNLDSILPGAGSLVFSVGMTIVWLAFVNQRRVRGAADSYARALLAVCDSGPLRQ